MKIDAEILNKTLQAGLHQTKTLLHSKESKQQNEETINREKIFASH
jgi:hypothetical protein